MNTVHSPSAVRKFYKNNPDETLMDDAVLPTHNGGLYSAPPIKLQRNWDRLKARIQDFFEGRDQHIKEFKARNMLHKTMVAQPIEDANGTSTYKHINGICGHADVSHSPIDKDGKTIIVNRVPTGTSIEYQSEESHTIHYVSDCTDFFRLRALAEGGRKFNGEIDRLAKSFSQ